MFCSFRQGSDTFSYVFTNGFVKLAGLGIQEMVLLVLALMPDKSPGEYQAKANAIKISNVRSDL